MIVEDLMTMGEQEELTKVVVEKQLQSFELDKCLLVKMMNSTQNGLLEMMSARQVDRLSCKVLARVPVEKILWR